MEFSHALVERYQQYLQRRCGIAVSVERAQSHLASFAQLYTSFSFPKEVGGGRGRPSPRPHPRKG